LKGKLEDVKFFWCVDHPPSISFFRRWPDTLDVSLQSMGHLSLCLLLCDMGADVDLKNAAKTTAAMLRRKKAGI